MNETTITRRSAITTGTLTALGVGLISAAGSTPAFAEPLPLPSSSTLATVVGYPGLEAESTRLHELSMATLTASVQARSGLDTLLTPEQRTAVTEYIENAHDEQHSVYLDVVVAELARHLPGLVPTIYTLWSHILEERDQLGTCCV